MSRSYPPTRPAALALALGLLVAAAGVARADVPNHWNVGDLLTADDLNQNFQDIDVRMKGKVENSAGGTRVEACQISHSAGITGVGSASGLCANWVASVQHLQTGLVRVNFVADTFSAPPVCTLAMSEEGGSWCPTCGIGVGNQTTTYVEVEVYNHASATSEDRWFNLTCVGKR